MVCEDCNLRYTFAREKKNVTKVRLFAWRYKALAVKLFQSLNKSEEIILQVNTMDSIKMNTAIEYGFYYAPVFSYYFSTGYFAWKKAYGSERNRSR